MRTCTTLLGSDRALSNPRASVGWGWREAGSPSLLPMGSSHLLPPRGAVGREPQGSPGGWQSPGMGFPGLLPPCLPLSWAGKSV